MQQYALIESPMSFAGSAKRVMRVSKNAAYRWLVAPWLLLSAWMLVSLWYLMFGWCLVPYRLVRRGQRKQVREQQRHNELIAALLSRSEASASDR